MTTSDIITAVVGIGGLLGAIYTISVQQRAKKPHIKVALNLGRRRYKKTGETSDAKLILKAVNKGERTVILNAHALLLPTKENLVLLDTESTSTLPIKLEPEQSCSVYYDARELVPMLAKLKNQKGMIKLTGYYRDFAGRTYKSPKLEFDPTLQIFDHNVEVLEGQRF